jgi:class 3 adenylate cyclase
MNSMKPVEQSLRFSVPHPRKSVWPILSHTDWLNRVIGLPPVDYTSRAQSGGGVTLEAKSKLLPGPAIRWKEYPFDWIHEKSFSERRVYLTGPFREFLAHFNMEEKDGVTEVQVSASIMPRTWMGVVLANLLTRKMKFDFRKVRHRMEAYLKREPVSDLPSFSKLPTDPVLLQEGIDKLGAQGWSAGLLARLAEFLRHAPDAEVVKIRAFRVADRWKEDRWEILKLFLHATRAGLVDLSWEVLCPNCRGDRSPRNSLAGLKAQVHCSTCQITFDSEFDQSVELKFSINPGVRPAPREIFCIGGPGQNANIAAQLVLGPGESRLWKLPTLAGEYRLRSPQVRDGATVISVEPGAGRETALRITSQGWNPAPPAVVDAESGLQIANQLACDANVILERLDWNRDVATAALVTGWQEFRDLFSKEILSPGEEITVGRQILLFTDLRGSTSMYQQIGDAPAYSLVREHFRAIEDILRRYHGGMVKTIGDAIMATFGSVTDAIAATVEMHRKIADLNRADSRGDLRLKAGLHVGPCIAVNANDRLDYFGSTVNLAARLTGQAREGEIILSDEFFQTHEAADFLKKKGFPTESFTAQLRGFGEARLLWRVRLEAK